jgi:hypothetical protein
MRSSATQYVLWLAREGADEVADSVLLERAGVEPCVEIRTKALSMWDTVTIPAGSRDEWGTVFAETLSVGSNQLPPEGRVYLVFGD